MKLKLTLEEVEELERILIRLREEEYSLVCPTAKECKDFCGVIFPPLTKRSLLSKPYRITCPCNAIRGKILTFSYVIRQVAKVLKDGGIK